MLLRVQSSDKVTSISLPAAPAYHVIEFELEVLSSPSAPVAGGEGGALGMTESHRKQKDTQTAGQGMATVDHKVRRGWDRSAGGGSLSPPRRADEATPAEVAGSPFLVSHPLVGFSVYIFESPLVHRARTRTNRL